MTLLFIDSFDHYTTDNQIEAKGYSRFFAGHSIEVGTGRRGGNCMSSAGIVINGVLTKAIAPDSDGLVLGMALSISQYKDSSELMLIQDTGGSVVLTLEHTASGELILTSGGQVRTTTSAVFAPSTYNYYEVKYLKGTGLDSYAEIRKDGVTLLTITNGDETTQASSFSPPNSEGSFYEVLIDDLYCLNTEGTDNNDFLGDVRVDVQLAGDNGTTNQFTPSQAALNHTMVDDVTPDDDTTFVESGTILVKDFYTVVAPTLGTEIHGIQQVAYSRKTDAGTVSVNMLTEKPAGTGEKLTNNETSSDDYKFHLGILEADPDDDVEWTDGRVTSTEFGFQIQDITT